MVSLVQASTSLPMFLLAFPAGALADIVDRRRVLWCAQIAMMIAAAALGLLALLDAVTPERLLVFTFLLGAGMAVNAPAWQAIVPELVPRDELPSAVVLNGITNNVARSVGPAIGGLVVAAAGPGAAFLLNAASFVAVAVVLSRWQREVVESPLPAERLLGAMRAGFRYVRRAPSFQAVVIRSGAFILCASSLWALFPLLALALDRGPAGYGVLLASFGAGALVAAVSLPKVRLRVRLPVLVAASTAIYGAGLLALAFLTDHRLASLVLAIAGGSWLTLLSTFNVAAQSALPSWVRARALALYLVVFFGAMAGGSALWGALAARAGIPIALVTSAIGVVAGLGLARRFPVHGGEGVDLAPSVHFPAPQVVGIVDHDRGPVMVTLEYRIEPSGAAEFAALMDEIRVIRERDGAFFWGLFVDAADRQRYVESFLVDSWVEHLRQHDRVTVSDRVILERARRFHVGEQPPIISHWIADDSRGAPSTVSIE